LKFSENIANEDLNLLYNGLVHFMLKTHVPELVFVNDEEFALPVAYRCRVPRLAVHQANFSENSTTAKRGHHIVVDVVVVVVTMLTRVMVGLVLVVVIFRWVVVTLMLVVMVLVVLVVLGRLMLVVLLVVLVHMYTRSYFDLYAIGVFNL
jgi:hypothetical protein